MMRGISLTVLLALLIINSAAATHTLIYSNAPTSNPLKGIVANYAHAPSDLAKLPHSLIFVPLALNLTVTNEGTYSWTNLEYWISHCTNDGSQIIPRFILDYPGKSTWLPQYLLDAGLWTTQYDGVSLFPDFTNAQLRACMTNFIAAFGAAYDGDPRIGFIQTGLIGPWGEWDVGSWGSKLYPHWCPTQTEAEVLFAFTNAFTKTKIQTRYPIGPTYYDVPSYENDNLPIGYHDDAFTTKTVPTDYSAESPDLEYYYEMRFMLNANATNKWKQWPYGGETYYNQGACIFSNPPCVIGVQTFSNCVASAHASYMHVSAAFYTNVYGWEYTSNALVGARQLGYELHVQSFSNWVDGANLNAAVTMTNTGVAPFYYPWSVALSAVTNGVAIKNWTNDWDIRTVVPGDGAMTFSQTLTSAPARPFTLLMRVLNPLTGGKQLHFANAEEGSTLTNWLTLGDVVDESVARIATIRTGSIRTP